MILIYDYITMIERKRGRPKGSTKKSSRKITRTDDLITMKVWDVRYYRKKDKDVTSWITQAWISWHFKTERVVIVHLGSSETEKWVLLTKIK